MARGLNKVQIIGNLGQEPDCRTTQQGVMVTTISVATSFSWKNKQTGQTETETEWHRVIFFGRVAELASQYLKKGSKVYVEGRNRTRKWHDTQHGIDRYTTEVIANTFESLDPRDSTTPTPQQQHQSSPQPQPGSGFDDDIPF